MDNIESRFDDDYDAFVFDVLLAAGDENEREAQFAAELARVGAGDRVLDVPCGVGRLTTHLSTIGCDVVGVDLSPSYVSRARDRASGSESFALADMCMLPFRRGVYDAIICWFISLGYYSEEFDEAFLLEAARCLRAGGSFVIEAVNPIGMVRTRADADGNFIEETWLDDDLMSLHLTYDPVEGRNNVERTIVKDGVVRRLTFSVRLYSPTELGGMLERCGFEVRRVVNREGAPLTICDGRMYIVAARK
jgi:SAM-dependent methyltransferase